MPNRSGSRLQEMPGVLSLSSERRHRRLPEARYAANKAPAQQSKEVAEVVERRLNSDLVAGSRRPVKLTRRAKASLRRIIMYGVGLRHILIVAGLLIVGTLAWFLFFAPRAQ